MFLFCTPCCLFLVHLYFGDFAVPMLCCPLVVFWRAFLFFWFIFIFMWSQAVSCSPLCAVFLFMFWSSFIFAINNWQRKQQQFISAARGKKKKARGEKEESEEEEKKEESFHQFNWTSYNVCQRSFSARPASLFLRGVPFFTVGHFTRFLFPCIFCEIFVHRLWHFRALFVKIFVHLLWYCWCNVCELSLHSFNWSFPFRRTRGGLCRDRSITCRSTLRFSAAFVT